MGGWPRIRPALPRRSRAGAVRAPRVGDRTRSAPARRGPRGVLRLCGLVARHLPGRGVRVRPEHLGSAPEQHHRLSVAPAGLERSAVALRSAQRSRGRRPRDRRGRAQRSRTALPAAGGVGVTVPSVTTAFIVFCGRGGPSEIERRLDSIKIAIGALVLARAGDAGFAPLLAVTADAEAHQAFTRGGADVVPPRTDPFHFGEELLGLTRARGLERIATIGAGAGALMSTSDLTRLREEIDAGEALVLSNNYYSADLIAFTPASALTVIDLPATDNPLPRRLHQQGGLSSRQLDRSAATLLAGDPPAHAP